jgi:transcriptional adapter 2-alpha
VAAMRKQKQSSPGRKNYGNVLPPMKSKVLPSVPANHEVQGYMPGREEFDMEHENEAEVAVKDMIFTEDDTPDDVDLKLAMLEIYNARLDARHDRKQFALARNFIDFRKTQSNDRKRSKDEKEVLNKMKPFAPLLNQHEFNSFVKSIMIENQLRDRIATLQQYRRHGVTTLKDAEEYETAKKARMSKIYAQSPFVGTSDRVVAKMLNDTAAASSSYAAYNRDISSNMTSVSGTTNTPPKMRNNPVPLDISSADGVDQLSASEKQLCSTLRIQPRAYLVIKQTLIREFEKRGSLKRRDARGMMRMDAIKMTKIYDFFLGKGWICS